MSSLPLNQPKRIKSTIAVGGLKYFEHIAELVPECKRLAAIPESERPQFKVKIDIHEFKPEIGLNPNLHISSEFKHLDIAVLNDRYLSLRFAFTLWQNERTDDFFVCVIFLYREEIARSQGIDEYRVKVDYVPREAGKPQFLLECDLTFGTPTAGGFDWYPCTYSNLTFPESKLADLDRRSGWKPPRFLEPSQMHSEEREPTDQLAIRLPEQPSRQPAVQPARQPAAQPAQRPAGQQSQLPPRQVPPVLQGREQTVARHDVVNKLMQPDYELLIGQDGSFYVRNKRHDVVLYEGTFSIYPPNSLLKIPTVRCALSCQLPSIPFAGQIPGMSSTYRSPTRPILSNGQPRHFLRPVTAMMNQPRLDRVAPILPTRLPPSTGLPPSVGQVRPVERRENQPGELRMTEERWKEHQQQQIHPVRHEEQQPIRRDIQQQAFNVLTHNQPMEEEPVSEKPHEDGNKEMNTNKHYEPISIDLSAEEEDLKEKSITQETKEPDDSETEEVPPW